MADIRFQSFEDGDLADIWYALGGAAIRHPDHFQPLADVCFQELLQRRGEGLNRDKRCEALEAASDRPLFQ